MATWLSGPGYRVRLGKVEAVVPTDVSHPEDGATILVAGTLLQVGEAAETVCQRLDGAVVERARGKIGFAGGDGR